MVGRAGPREICATDMTNPFGFSRPVPEPFDPFGALDPGLTGDCGTMISRLYHFLDGELTEQRRAKIQGHLDGCPSCYSAFDFEAELRIVVANRAQSQVPPQLVERIRLSLFESSSQFPQVEPPEGPST
jgi:anti-sigma factor (TIGR02949 family)